MLARDLQTLLEGLLGKRCASVDQHSFAQPTDQRTSWLLQMWHGIFDATSRLNVQAPHALRSSPSASGWWGTRKASDKQLLQLLADAAVGLHCRRPFPDNRRGHAGGLSVRPNWAEGAAVANQALIMRSWSAKTPGACEQTSTLTCGRRARMSAQ